MQQDIRSQRFPILTTVACIVCVVIFLAINMQGSSSSWDDVRRWGMYSDRDIFNGAYWALVTTAFVHVQPIHLLFNLYWLWHLGGAFERQFGPLKWLAFVLAAAWVSSGIELYAGSSGIGMSGVGYALFGFGWMSRRRLPEFARIVNDNTVALFIGWGVLCILTTYLGVMEVANLAHFGGLLFGVVVGFAYVSPGKEGLLFPLVALLTIASAVPLYYNPMSVEWLDKKAAAAYDRKDWREAELYYKKAAERSDEPSWAWKNLAQIYEFTGREQEFQQTIAQLRKIDPEAAEALLKEHTQGEVTTSKPSP